jgi:cytochrome oxidase Cu insertion factor (SCO1/SenC/PrrC family)
MAVVLGLAIVAVPSLGAGQEGKPAPEANTGLAVGEPAPRFTLKDQAGNERSLDNFLKKGKLALVFFRSADW